MAEGEDDGRLYRVVVNDEQQYSIWLDSKPNPPGWRDVGMVGYMRECVAHVEEVWTDMRPKSARQAPSGAASSTSPPEAS